MRLAIVVFCLSLAFLCACSNEPYIDRTHRAIAVSSIDENEIAHVKGAIYTTDEAPITLPNCTLKKVSVQRNNESFRYLAFVEPNQVDKITRKGQQVKLYEIQYYFSSSGQPQSLLLARVE